MQALRIVLLLVALAVGYVMFFRSQPRLEETTTTPAAAVTEEESAGTAMPKVAHSQYKEALDKAHVVAGQMRAEQTEANSY